MHPLQALYLQKEQYNAIQKFLIQHLKEIAINKSFNGNDTSGIKEAREAIQNAFNQLEQEYGEKSKKKVNNISR